MEKETIRIPVLIVGSGPTGLLAANLLGQLGVSTLLVEQNASISDLPKAILLDDEGFRSLQAVQLSDVVQEKALMGYGARYYSPSGVCFAKIAPTVAEYGFPRRNSFMQPELEQDLADGLKRFDCVETRYRTTLTHLTHTPDQVEVTLLGPEEQQIYVKTDFLLACDGGRSTVRELLGIEMVGSTYEQDWIVLDTKNATDRDRYSKFFCDPARPGVSIPAPHGGRRYEFMLLDGEDKEAMVTYSSVKKLLQNFREIKEADLIRAIVYTFHARVAERLTNGRIALMGDAAHLTPPFAGQGMNAGLRDAHNVAWKIALVLKGIAAPSILESYERERRGPMKTMIDFAVALGNIVMPTNPIRGQIMEAMIDVLALFPEAQDYVLNMKFKPKPHYSDGLFLKDDEDGESVVAGGKMFPQPKVCEKDGQPTLLDNLMGGDFALLAIGSGSQESLLNLRHTLWSKLDVQRIVLCQDVLADVSGQAKTVQMMDEDYGIMKQKGKILLIRPDRYVAGSFFPEQEAVFAERFETLLKPD